VIPGASVKISELADEDISKLLSNKPATEFPVNIAIARVQQKEYTNFRYSRPQHSEPEGKFSMILTRDAEEDKAFEKISELNGVQQASPFNRLLLPYQYKSVKDLRMTAVMFRQKTSMDWQKLLLTKRKNQMPGKNKMRWIISAWQLRKKLSSSLSLRLKKCGAE
jgi:hypothetical protein